MGNSIAHFYPCTSTGIPRTHLLRSLLVPEMAKQVELSVRCVVKGYHECPFEANVGEIFYTFKKRGERGNAFGKQFPQLINKLEESDTEET